MPKSKIGAGIVLVAIAVGCGGGPRDEQAGATSGLDQDDLGATAGDDDDDTAGEKLDVGNGGATAGAGDGMPSCKVLDEYDGEPSNCDVQAPPDSFTPAVQWSFTPDDGNTMILATPLVVNLTDDNGDGAIDLCDIPDVVVAAMRSIGTETLPSPDPAFIYVVDGATGTLHYKIDLPIGKLAQPAVGDIDGDGVAEIIAVLDKPLNTFAIWEHDGTLKLMSEPTPKFTFSEAIGLADIDADGDVEIIIGEQAFDHEGRLLWFGNHGAQGDGAASVAVDLDDDGYLEVVVGHSAFRHDGELYYLTLDIGEGGSAWANGYPQIANLDDDDDPEIIVTNEKGISILEHDGTIKLAMLTPTGDPPVGLNWARPAAVHDFDGDGLADIAMSSAAHFSVFSRDGSILWSRVVDDPSGAAAGTAFDFLGDGSAEAMYADERNFFAYDGPSGTPLLSTPRLSRTMVEYPVVADIDNDGSAEVLVVSNETIQGDDDEAPALQAIRDADDRWVPARRIWNQHAYHVTNVREDGTIPQHQAKHWLSLNTFRTQAQIGVGGVCNPPKEG